MEWKLFEMGLNIGKIHHVCGRTQERLTLEEARVAQVGAVMPCFCCGPCVVCWVSCVEESTSALQKRPHARNAFDS